MITYLENQRRSLRFTNEGWMEEVLAASGVESDTTEFSLVAGDDVQQALESVDNVLAGLDVSTASGVLVISDVANVENVTQSGVGTLDAVSMPHNVDSAFKFSFAVPAQPVSPVHIRLLYAGGAEVSGQVGIKLEYDIFDQSSDLTPAVNYDLSSGDLEFSVADTDFESLKIYNFSIPAATFAAAGSAPYIVTAKVTRDSSVASNYEGALNVVGLYADNIPGAATGNEAGYIGGNLNVTGDLSVDGHTVLQFGNEPATAGDTGVQGRIAFADNFLYVAVDENTWKRVSLSSF